MAADLAQFTSRCCFCGKLSWEDLSDCRRSLKREDKLYHGERFNSLSHLLGSVAAIAGLVVLVVVASQTGDPWKIVSVSIYGSTLVLLYLFSTLYHSLKNSSKKVFRKLDHLAIYLLIAGTYTPFTLVTLRGAWGWSLFGINWGLACIGIVYELLAREGRRIIPVFIYLAMGWLIVIALPHLRRELPAPGMAWLVAGGLFYTLGIGFYAFDKKVNHFHGIWHLFVLAGSLCHFLAIQFYVL